jgi:arabinogalactan endo-1,4-beta-galactosidase
VLTDEAAARHKEVLADWVVDGLLSRGDNFRLYSFMSNMLGKTKEEIPKHCYNYYKTVEPTLQDAYQILRDVNRNQLKNLVVAETMKQQLKKLPADCAGK